MSTATWFALGATACAVLAWLALRRPTVLLLGVLATFAVGPEWLLAGGAAPTLVAWLVPGQILLLLVGLLANAARYGVRLDMANGPLLVTLWLLAQSLLLADLDPAITAPALLAAALSLALPWCLVHVGLQPGSRVHYALLIALLPALCAAAGGVLELLEIRPLFSGSEGRGARMQGATNAGWLAFLAFTGFAVALHEGARRRRLDFAGLAALNLAIALMSMGRMALIACGILATVYALLTPALRSTAARVGLVAVVGAGGLLAVALQVPPHEVMRDPSVVRARARRGRACRLPGPAAQ